ncbi:MAG: threonine synthase [Halobacteriaceae archaeon]
METTPAFAGVRCVDCASTFDGVTATHRCPSCGGILNPHYDLEEVSLTRAGIDARDQAGLWRYEELLPFPESAGISLAEGQTPLVDCPTLAESLGVERVLIKDEGRNPTGTFKDRGQALAVTAAREHDATDIALATAGNAGQAGAAYAARAGLDAHVFVPSRAGFTQKAMTNVHGADMTVVEGRIGDAVAAYEDAIADNPSWYSTQTFVTPYRHEGKKTMLYEIVEQLGWTVPDAIVYPTGGGVGLVGMHKGATEFQSLGLIDDRPPLYAAQSEGCAPIVDAVEAGRGRHEPWATPDTICGGIEIPDPGASPLILDAIRESGGGAVATSDEAILDAAVQAARHTGLELGGAAGAALSGASALAARGDLGQDDTVVVLATGAGNKDADVLRSHLMAQGE